MAEVILTLSGEPQGKSKEEILEVLEAEVDRFDRFMSTLGDWKTVGPMSKPERALILTYLVQKFTGKLDKEF